MVIRPVAVDDSLAAFDVPHGMDTDEPRRRALVADLDGRVVAAGSLMWSTRHPDMIAASIEVIDDFRRQGIGSEMLNELEALAGRPITFNIAPSEASNSFLRHADYQLIVTSETRRLVVSAALNALEEAGVWQVTPKSVSIREAKELSREMVTLYEAIYAKCHTWAGRYEAPSGAPWIDFAGPTVGVPATVQLAGVDGTPIAVTSLHSGPFAEGADAFLPPTTVLYDLGLEERSSILRCLVQATLRAAELADIGTVNVEYDSPYDDLSAVVDSLPTTPVQRREIWQRQNQDPASFSCGDRS